MLSLFQGLLGLSNPPEDPEDTKDTDTPEHADYYPTCPRDVYSAAWTLQHFLPWELVRLTLDLAEYWPRLTVENESEFPPVTERRSPHNCAVLPIHTFNTRRVQPVRKVTFSITARDQGWASNPDGGSWTWFTVSVNDKRSVDDLEHRLATNRIMVKDWQTHDRIWYADEAMEEPAEGECSATLMRLMVEGSEVRVLTHARFPAWTNRVRKARIEAFIAVLH
jgi:hypothetical protein